MDARVVINTESAEAEDTQGTVTAEDNEGPLDLSLKRGPQTTIPLAATETVTETKIRSYPATEEQRATSSKQKTPQKRKIQPLDPQLIPRVNRVPYQQSQSPNCLNPGPNLRTRHL